MKRRWPATTTADVAAAEASDPGPKATSAWRLKPLHELHVSGGPAISLERNTGGAWPRRFVGPWL